MSSGSNFLKKEESSIIPLKVLKDDDDDDDDDDVIFVDSCGMTFRNDGNDIAINQGGVDASSPILFSSSSLLTN